MAARASTSSCTRSSCPTTTTRTRSSRSRPSSAASNQEKRESRWALPSRNRTLARGLLRALRLRREVEGGAELHRDAVEDVLVVLVHLRRDVRDRGVEARDVVARDDVLEFQVDRDPVGEEQVEAGTEAAAHLHARVRLH